MVNMERDAVLSPKSHKTYSDDSSKQTLRVDLLTGEKLDTQDEPFESRFRTLSKDYEEHLGLGLALGMRKIGKIFIDGKRVETMDIKTTLPSFQAQSPRTRRDSLKFNSVVHSQRDSE